MSRSALETCILGVYCLFAQDPVSGLRAESLRTGLAAMVELLGDVVPRNLLEESVSKVGTAGRSVGVRDMAKYIDRELGGDGTSKLYGLVYAPTSNYFSHANAGTLIRHVRPDDTLSRKPANPWLRRSPVRVADASVGILAVHLARYESVPAEAFSKYAKAHLARVLPPLLSLLGKRMGKSAGWLPLARILLRARRMRTIMRNPDLTDARRESLARDLFRDVSLALDLDDVPNDAFTPVIDHFIQEIVKAYAGEPES